MSDNTCNVGSSELKEKMERLARLEKVGRGFVNTMSCFIFIFDKDFIFRDIILPKGMSLLHPKEQLLGTSGRNIFTPEVSDMYEEHIRECLASGEKKEMEYYLLIGDVKYYFQATMTPYDEDKVFAMITDIGDRVKRMDDLMEAKKRAEYADKMKSIFLANMSHEIRTPLNSIVGFTEILAEEEDPALKAEYLEIIRTSNNLLLQLINDILDISRIEAGNVDMNFQETDIIKLTDEVGQTSKVKMQRGVEFVLDMPANAEMNAVTDRNRVVQVLSNFISNAIKNTREGSITLKLEEADNFLKFSVTDTGSGIPADKLKTIFNRFEKLNDQIQGTGLGLAICETLVKRLGGEIAVESEVGKGSTFSFTIPYNNLGASDKDGNKGRKTVMIVNESDDSYNLMGAALTEEFNTRIVRVSSDMELKDSLMRDLPDLILINTADSDMNGIETIKKIREKSPKVSIVAVTTSGVYMESQWALEGGANDVLYGTYSPSKLKETVAAFI